MENLGEGHITAFFFISITSKGKVKLKDKFFKTLLLGQQEGLVSKDVLIFQTWKPKFSTWGTMVKGKI